MMNKYYFKIDTPAGVRYCEFVAGDKERAYRNALFACFFDQAMDDIGRDIKNLSHEEKYGLLHSKFSDRITDTTKETYEEKDEKQHD